MKTSYTAQINDVVSELPPLPWDAACVCEDVMLETIPLLSDERPLTIARFEETAEDDCESAKLRACYVSHACNTLPKLVEVCRDALALLVNGEGGSELRTQDVVCDLRAALSRAETVNLIQMDY